MSKLLTFEEWKNTVEGATALTYGLMQHHGVEIDEEVELTMQAEYRHYVIKHTESNSTKEE